MMDLENILKKLNVEPDLRYGFCRCGCGEAAPIPRWSDKSRGWISGVPLEYCKGHSVRIMTSVHVDATTQCWIWLKGIRPDGYGQAMTRINKKAKLKRAHVLVWEWAYGPVPKGLYLDHLCRTRSCVNPNHLRVVTFVENVRCGLSATINPVIARQIKQLGSTGLSHPVIAQKLQLSKRIVRDVLIGRTWKELD